MIHPGHSPAMHPHTPHTHTGHHINYTCKCCLGLSSPPTPFPPPTSPFPLTDPILLPMTDAKRNEICITLAPRLWGSWSCSCSCSCACSCSWPRLRLRLRLCLCLRLCTRFDWWVFAILGRYLLHMQLLGASYVTSWSWKSFQQLVERRQEDCLQVFNCSAPSIRLLRTLHISSCTLSSWFFLGPELI